jgi:hypothetical protein
MKRSGQRWSERGCDRMVLLRAAYKSEKFHLITDLFRQENCRLNACFESHSWGKYRHVNKYRQVVKETKITKIYSIALPHY